MPDPRRLRRSLVVETLEGRALLSHVPPVKLAAARPPALVRTQAITTDPGAVAAIVSALNGGSGAEWATLIRKQVRNPQSVIAKFATGRINSFTTPGVTFRTPAEQPDFTGSVYDQLLPTVAGAAVFKKNVFELASIMRGPFRNPNTSYYVFALDRGAGAGVGPVFASRPGIVADTLVTITVGPFGSSASGEIRDLTTGATQTIDPSRISIRSATLRVFLDAGQFPSKGLPLGKYRFNMWTQVKPGNDIADVAGFALDGVMAPVSMQKGIAARR